MNKLGSSLYKTFEPADVNRTSKCQARAEGGDLGTHPALRIDGRWICWPEKVLMELRCHDSDSFNLETSLLFKRVFILLGMDQGLRWYCKEFSVTMSHPRKVNRDTDALSQDIPGSLLPICIRGMAQNEANLVCPPWFLLDQASDLSEHCLVNHLS